MTESKWPKRLYIARHGQSAGNAALEAAMAAQLPTIGLEIRDADVPLSDIGRRQAAALGAWFSTCPPDNKPQIIVSSPFVRAVGTAAIVEQAAGLSLECPRDTDERLREKEFGHFDGLTAAGVKERFPAEAALRARVGKFYYRPPGGESWCDVVFRLRSAIDTISLHYAGRNVLIVAHQVIVLCLRYLLEDLDEKQVLAIDAAGDVGNCSVTEYSLHNGKLALDRYNYVVPVAEGGAPVTAEPRKNKAGA